MLFYKNWTPGNQNDPFGESYFIRNDHKFFVENTGYKHFIK